MQFLSPHFFSTLIANLDSFIKENFGKMPLLICNASTQIMLLKSITQTTILNLALSPRIDIVKKAMPVPGKKELAFEVAEGNMYLLNLNVISKPSKQANITRYIYVCKLLFIYLNVKPQFEINVNLFF